MVYQQQKNARIIDGPGLKRLLDAFAYAYDRSAKIYAEFSVVDDDEQHRDGNRISISKKCIAKITSISHENGSGSSFNIGGYYSYGVKGQSATPTDKFSGYYDAKRRQGWLTLTYLTADDK